jgi:hypothetical protein
MLRLLLASTAFAFALVAAACSSGDPSSDDGTGSPRTTATESVSATSSNEIDSDPNPLELAAEELLPPDATVLERTDSVCIYGVPQPSCEFVIYIRRGIPFEQRIADAKARAERLGWDVHETRYDSPGQSGNVLLELSRGERFAEWSLKTSERNQRCFDKSLELIFCADLIAMY